MDHTYRSYRNFLYNSVGELGRWLEKMNGWKDQVLFSWIKVHWDKRITPNHLTYVRFGIGSLLFILLFGFRNDSGLVILPLFLVGALTDLLDGAVARCLHMETKLGKIIDPIADRFLLIPVAIYSLISYQWLLFFLIFLEIENAFIALVEYGKGITTGLNIFGKTKMVIQSLVFIGILLFWPRTPNFIFIDLLWLSAFCMVISIFLKLNGLKAYYQSLSRNNE